MAGSRPARFLFWAAALFALVMALLPHPPDIPAAPSDKVQHIIAFAALALLIAWAYPARSAWRLLAFLSLFGALIELLQAIPLLHRDSDPIDWVADTAAAGAILLLLSWFRGPSRLDG